MSNKNTAVFTVLFACLILIGCGGKRAGNSLSSLSLRNASAQNAADYGNSANITAEDLLVLAMPLEQRKEYLRRKLEEEIDERREREARGLKASSSITDERNKVEKTISHSTPKEDLTLEWNDTAHRWELSFLERLSGDMNFSGKTEITDCTALAQRFLRSKTAYPYFEDRDYQIDRVTNGDGVLNIADLTILSMNFNESMRSGTPPVPNPGYKVYYAAARDSETWTELPNSTLLFDPPNQPPPPFRERYHLNIYKSVYLELGINLTNKWLAVKPFNSEGTEGCLSEPIQFEETQVNPPNQDPVAALHIDYNGQRYDKNNVLKARAPITVTLDASESSDQDQGDHIVYYRFDVNDDGVYEYEQASPTLNYTFASPTITTIRLEVEDTKQATGRDTVPIRATGAAQVTGFTTYLDGKVTHTAETGQEVTFTATALDPDETPGADLTFKFDFNGDYIPDYTGQVTTLSPLDTASCTTTWTYLSSEQQTHSQPYDVSVWVSNKATPIIWTIRSLSQFPDDSNVLYVEHPVPHFEGQDGLVITPNPPNGTASVQSPFHVTFNAAAAKDNDGVNGKPDKIRLYPRSPLQPPYYEAGYPNAELDYDYTEGGIFNASVEIWDEDASNQTCADPRHKPSFSVPLKVYGLPQAADIVLVDNGRVSGYDWTLLGTPAIAVAINPRTRQPGIAYSGRHFRDGQTEIPTDPRSFSCFPLFSERDALGNWPVPTIVDSQYGYNLGYQVDLEYHPVVMGEEENQAVTGIISATYYSCSVSGGDPTEGIYQYACTSSSLVSESWTTQPTGMKQCIFEDFVNFHCPLRLVSKTDGDYTQFRQIAPDEGLYLASPGYNGSVLLVSEQDSANLSHDLKSLNGLRTLDSFQPCGSAYTYQSMDGELRYLEQADELNWGEAYNQVSLLYPSDCYTGARGIALDYFGSERFGVLWVEQDFNPLDGNSKDIVFRECVDGTWGNEQTVFDGFLYGLDGSLAGNWCDFDYDTDIGIGCAAYEVVDGIERALYAQLYGLNRDQNGNPLWLPEPIWITDIISSGNMIESHVDLDIDNGYIYIAYSNKSPEIPPSVSEAAIYCATLDLLNRP